MTVEGQRRLVNQEWHGVATFPRGKLRGLAHAVAAVFVHDNRCVEVSSRRERNGDLLRRSVHKDTSDMSVPSLFILDSVWHSVWDLRGPRAPPASVDSTRHCLSQQPSSASAASSAIELSHPIACRCSSGNPAPASDQLLIRVSLRRSRAFFSTLTACLNWCASTPSCSWLSRRIWTWVRVWVLCKKSTRCIGEQERRVT